MYTWNFFKPWNNALRGLDENNLPDGDQVAGLAHL